MFLCRNCSQEVQSAEKVSLVESDFSVCRWPEDNEENLIETISVKYLMSARSCTEFRRRKQWMLGCEHKFSWNFRSLLNFSDFSHLMLFSVSNALCCTALSVRSLLSSKRWPSLAFLPDSGTKTYCCWSNLPSSLVSAAACKHCFELAPAGQCKCCPPWTRSMAKWESVGIHEFQSLTFGSEKMKLDEG